MKPFLLLGCFVFGCIVMATYSFRASRMQATDSSRQSVRPAHADVEVTPYGTSRDGQAVTLYTCRNKNGLTLKMMDWGATIVALETPDRAGHSANIVLTCADLAAFEDCTMYFNSTIGRYANRIANGQFKVNGNTYQLATNNGPNHLHGGQRGFDKRLWKAQPIKTEDEIGVQFRYVSPDGEEGYPGNVEVQVSYVLNNNDELVVEYRAHSDRATPVNLTNHNYWNLAGAGTILEHELRLHCDRYLPVDDTSIPTGELRAVAGTPFDFTQPRAIGERIGQLDNDPQGYDHCYVVNGEDGRLRLAAEVVEPRSGRTLSIWTTEPGIQFYSGNYLNGGIDSAGYAQYSGFCLETQRYPDSPNRPDFPSSILQPGDRYYHKTVHKFGIAR